MRLETPYYLIDERRLLGNLKTIQRIKKNSGAKIVLALKCFSAWCVFDLMKKYLDGTTSSSLYETRLGCEKFGKETHAYSAAWSAADISEIPRYADKIIFNSLAQLKRFSPKLAGRQLGLRINPGFSYSRFDLADPARRYSRLGAIKRSDVKKALPFINGAMFHFNCENDDFPTFSSGLDRLSRDYKNILEKLDWVSLGGGLYFTRPGYPIGRFAAKLKSFSRRFHLQVYLEPGEAAITGAAELVTKVLDIVHNRMDIAMIDASTEAHMLDLLIYRQPAKIDTRGPHKYMIAGRSCLAGDVFGVYGFKKPLRVGQTIRIADAAGYTMVKKNWFNGLAMPAIAVKKLDRSLEVARRFGYNDFVKAMS